MTLKTWSQETCILISKKCNVIFDDTIKIKLNCSIFRRITGDVTGAQIHEIGSRDYRFGFGRRVKNKRVVISLRLSTGARTGQLRSSVYGTPALPLAGVVRIARSPPSNFVDVLFV